MTEDLLAREREFHRLNRELEQRTRDLMREVDSVITSANERQDFKTLTLSDENIAKDCAKRTVNASHNFHRPLSSKSNGETQVDDLDEISAKREKNVASKAIVSFLKGKVELLQNELQSIRLEYKKKCDYCKELEVEQKKSDDQKIKLQNQIDSLKESVAKLESGNANLQSQAQAVNTENAALKKDVDGLQKQVKALNQQSSNYDVRLNRAAEDNEKLRNTLKCSNIEEKELRNQIRKLQEDKRLAIKSLEKQRTELLQAFKKQALLVENLRKQNVLLSATGRMKFMEEDFLRLLDQRSEGA